MFSFFYVREFIGKTCLLVRFKDGTFLAGSFIATVGIDFRNKIVALGDKKIKLQIFDTVNKILIFYFILNLFI
jgi:hypothetical protein